MLVSDIMSTDILSVQPTDAVAVAARLLSRRNVGVLPVTDSRGRLKGILTDRDIVTRCIAAGRDPAHTAVSQIMTQKTVTADPQEPVAAVTARMAAAQVRRLPITEENRIVGMLSLGDLAVLPDHSTEAAACLESISRRP